MYKKEIKRAQEHFANIIREQIERVERMKKEEEWIDYSKSKPIIIGIAGGDGIGPYIAREAERVLKFLLENEERKG